MNHFSIPDLRRRAEESLNAVAYPPQAVVMLYVGIAVAMSVLSSFAADFLGEQINSLQGLSTLNTRTILSTVQSLLIFLPGLLLPYLDAGYTHYTMLVIAGRDPGKEHLSDGFRRFLSITGAIIFRTIPMIFVSFFLYMVIAIGYLSFFGDTTAIMAALETGAVSDPVLLPMMVCLGVASLISFLFFFYRYRLVDYGIFDQPHLNALFQLHRSKVLMKSNLGNYIRLDLHFWWYWLLQLVPSGLLYLDLILPFFGMELPTSAFVTNLLCYGLWGASKLAIAWFTMNPVQCTYAAAYASVMEQVQSQAVTQAQKFDWSQNQ